MQIHPLGRGTSRAVGLVEVIGHGARGGLGGKKWEIALVSVAHIYADSINRLNDCVLYGDMYKSFWIAVRWDSNLGNPRNPVYRYRSLALGCRPSVSQAGIMSVTVNSTFVVSPIFHVKSVEVRMEYTGSVLGILTKGGRIPRKE